MQTKWKLNFTIDQWNHSFQYQIYLYFDKLDDVINKYNNTYSTISTIKLIYNQIYWL